MRSTRGWSTSATMTIPTRRRLRSRGLPIMPWRIPDRARIALPLPESLNRLAAARFVFCLGIGWLLLGAGFHAGAGAVWTRLRRRAGRLLGLGLHRGLLRL